MLETQASSVARLRAYYNADCEAYDEVRFLLTRIDELDAENARLRAAISGALAQWWRKRHIEEICAAPRRDFVCRRVFCEVPSHIIALQAALGE
jgi:diphthamide synthase (EF-2-diphthine--ammonia ligase)